MAEPSEALDTIDLLYQAATEPHLWPQALQNLASAVGGAGTAMIPITPLNTAGLIVSPELGEPNIEYEREWWRHDTRVLRIHSRKLADGVCCESELFTDDEIARDPLRQDFLRSYGLGAFAAQLVRPLPNLVVAFSVQRSLKRGQFERHQLDTLHLLGRHAARALVISLHLAAARSVERTLAETLARFACAAFVVDHELKILQANAAAERLIGGGLSTGQGRLQASCREQRDDFARFIAAVLEDSLGAGDLRPIALPRPDGRRPLLAQAIPLRGEPSSLPAGAAALLLVVDPDEQADHGPTEALRLLGLTRSEARLAALIGAGFSRGDAADALGISETTASDTIKQVYLKLDISRQSQLVQLVDRLAVLQRRR